LLAQILHEVYLYDLIEYLLQKLVAIVFLSQSGTVDYTHPSHENLASLP